MFDEKFMKIEGLRFEELADDSDENAKENGMDIIAPWLPHGKGIVARLHNRKPGAVQFDYVIIMEDMVYFAILTDHSPYTSDKLPLSLRSLKAFKGDIMSAFAFILEPLSAGEAKDVPQIRLMLSDDKRITLVLDNSEDAARLTTHLQELATKNFFIS